MPDVQPIPVDYPRVMPYLIVDGAAAAIDFYREVLGAQERLRVPGEDGRVAHAELQVGDAVVMLADPQPDRGVFAPGHFGGSPVSLMVYVEDVDATFAAAVARGSTSVHDIEDQFYGDRSGTLTDPFGHQWTIASHVEDVSEEEMGRRMAEMGA